MKYSALLSVFFIAIPLYAEKKSELHLARKLIHEVIALQNNKDQNTTKINTLLNQAEQYAKQTLSDDPSGAYQFLGYIRYMQDDYDGAITYFKEGAELSDLYCIRFLAVMYVKQNRLTDTIIALEKALEKYPNNEELIYMLGYVVEKNGNVDKAKEYYTISAKIGYPIASGRLAHLEGNLDQAEKYYHEAIKTNRGAYYLLSKLYEEKGKMEEAKEYWNKVIEFKVIY